MKNLKVTINRSAGVKKYEVLPRQEKDMRGCCFCIKTQTARKPKYAEFVNKRKRNAREILATSLALFFAHF